MPASPSQPLDLRNAPKQRRTRERLELALDAAEALLAEEGYDAFTTTAVAARAGLSPATVYRWFADKHELARAILARHAERVDAALRERLAALEDPTLDALFDCVHALYIAYYRAYPSHVILWFEGRVSRTTVAAVHAHTGQLSEELHRVARQHDLIGPSVCVLDVRVLLEALDRLHEFAFRERRDGDEEILRRAVQLTRLHCGQLRAG